MTVDGEEELRAVGGGRRWRREVERSDSPEDDDEEEEEEDKPIDKGRVERWTSLMKRRRRQVVSTPHSTRRLC